MQTPLKNLILVVVCCFITGCATDRYEPKPLHSNAVTEKILNKDPTSHEFIQYLREQGYKEADLPLNTWGLDELTICSLFHHTKLDVAKAQLGLALAAIDTAGVRQTPVLSASIAHSNLANGDKRPWAYGLNVEIPIETAGKRELKIEEAQKLAEVAHMDVADIAWQLRDRISQDLLEYHQNIANTQLLESELATQTDIVNMLQKRTDAGLASKTELSYVQLLALKTLSMLNNERSKLVEINAKLAADVGLTIDKFKKIAIKPLALESILAQQTATLDVPSEFRRLQEDALLNRIDIRRSMAKYAAAEAKIKLEIAKQTPDISLSPGVAFDFGDSIWSLGFSTLLNLINKNATLINEAKQLREIEGAQFENLQAQVISNLSQHYAGYEGAKQALSQAQLLHNTQLQHMLKLQKQFEAGLIDRLELKQASLNTIISQQQVLVAQFMILKATYQIENVMQKPLYTHFMMPN